MVTGGLGGGWGVGCVPACAFLDHLGVEFLLTLSAFYIALACEANGSVLHRPSFLALRAGVPFGLNSRRVSSSSSILIGRGCCCCCFFFYIFLNYCFFGRAWRSGRERAWRSGQTNLRGPGGPVKRGGDLRGPGVPVGSSVTSRRQEVAVMGYLAEAA